jgi:hypothetical protein
MPLFPESLYLEWLAGLSYNITSIAAATSFLQENIKISHKLDVYFKKQFAVKLFVEQFYKSSVDL